MKMEMVTAVVSVHGNGGDKQDWGDLLTHFCVCWILNQVLHFFKLIEMIF